MHTEASFSPSLIDWLCLRVCLDAYILRYADFCVNDNDNNDDITNYFTPYACARGNNKEGGVSYSTVQQLLGKIVIIKSYLCLNSLHTLSALVHASASVILHGFPPSHGQEYNYKGHNLFIMYS